MVLCIEYCILEVLCGFVYRIVYIRGSVRIIKVLLVIILFL